MIAVTIVVVLLSLLALLINLPLSRTGRPSGGIPLDGDEDWRTP